MNADVPEHYQKTIVALIKLGLLGIALGMILGIVWTDYRKNIRFGEEARIVTIKGKEKLEIPAGKNFETGLKLKLSHGHSTLILGILPLCFAAALHMSLIYGAPKKRIGAGAMKAFFWLYTTGAVGTVSIIVYRGWASFAAIRAKIAEGAPLTNQLMQQVQDDLFGGSRALRGAAYGITHTVLAIGTGVLIYQLWRALGKTPASKSTPADEPPTAA